MAGPQLLRFLKDDEYPYLESINKDQVQRGGKKPKTTQVSLFLKCTEILPNLASSKYGINWSPQLAACGPVPLLKCSLPRERGMKASQSSAVSGQPTMCSIFTCKKIHMPTTKPFQMCVEKLFTVRACTFSASACVLVSPPEKCSRFAHGLHGSRGTELILSHETFANRSRFAILFFPLCPSTLFQKVLFFFSSNPVQPFTSFENW